MSNKLILSRITQQSCIRASTAQSASLRGSHEGTQGEPLFSKATPSEAPCEIHPFFLARVTKFQVYIGPGYKTQHFFTVQTTILLLIWISSPSSLHSSAGFLILLLARSLFRCTVSPLHTNKFHSESAFLSALCKCNKVSRGTQLTQWVI